MINGPGAPSSSSAATARRSLACPNVVDRVESSWRPASAKEGFEIVRRQLFEPFADQARFKDRDVIARAFADLYRGQRQEFPPECRDGRLRLAGVQLELTRYLPDNRTVPATGTTRGRPSRSWPRTAPGSCVATRTAWRRPSASGCAPL